MYVIGTSFRFPTESRMVGTTWRGGMLESFLAQRLIINNYRTMKLLDVATNNFLGLIKQRFV